MSLSENNIAFYKLYFKMHHNARNPSCQFIFLAFGIGSAIVGNSYFVNAEVWNADDLCRYLRFKAKSFFFQGNIFNDVCTKKFVAGFHIREVQIGEHVGSCREEFIPDRVPEK